MSRPSIVELECFVAVAEELSFSKAAGRMNLTQPPLSRHIRALEEKVGSRLFDRDTRSVALTSAGAMFLRDTASLLVALDAAAESVKRASLGETSRLRIAFVGALLDETFARVIQEFRKSHPTCQVHLTDLPPRTQMERIADASVDLAFAGASPRRLPANLRSIIWKVEPLLVALSAGHRLAVPGTINLKDLRDEPWVMVSRQAAPEFRFQFDKLCQDHGFRPRVVEETDRVPAVMTMVAAGQGISLLPAGVSHLLPSAVRFLPVSNRSRPMLEHVCLYRGNSTSKETLAFLGNLKKSGTGRRV
jgi:DNA-binding transcriptional LysR family regulator